MIKLSNKLVFFTLCFIPYTLSENGYLHITIPYTVKDSAGIHASFSSQAALLNYNMHVVAYVSSGDNGITYSIKTIISESAHNYIISQGFIMI